MVMRVSAVRELLVVADEAAAFHDPWIGALDDPAAADDDEALHPGCTADDLDYDMGLVLGPFDEFPGIAAVGENTFDKGEPVPGLFQHPFCSIAILDLGAVDFDRKQPTVGVRQNVPLAAVDAFSGVATLASPF